MGGTFQAATSEPWGCSQEKGNGTSKMPKEREQRAPPWLRREPHPACLCLMVPGSSPALGRCQVEDRERGHVSPSFLRVKPVRACAGHLHPTGDQGGGSGLGFGVPTEYPVALEPSRADPSRTQPQE